MRIVFANVYDENSPSGGAKQCYRHIDVLNQLGFDACFVHTLSPDFRFTWFANQTPTIHIDYVKLTADDYIIHGEIVDGTPKVPGWERCGKVILCQNQYTIMRGFGGDIMRMRNYYRDAAAVLCPSEHTTDCIRYVFPSARVMRFRYSFDREPWGFHGDKQKVVSVMPRKRGAEIDKVLSIVGANWMAPGWNLVRINAMCEKDVANILKQSAIFISLSEQEGFGMPPAEAMACGCVVVGYTGYSGHEFMLPGITFPVEDGDFISLTRTLTEAMAMPVKELSEIGLKASEFIRGVYSTKSEVESIKKAWTAITRNVIEIRTETRERMKKDVAVYMPVYNEGPYLESLLRWLYPRVASVFVAESKVSWAPNGNPGGKSKVIVDKVLAEYPEARNVIRYMVVGDNADQDNPLKREANQRNDILGRIREFGFKFVWMVEADEFYRDEEAEMLWDWFFQKSEDGIRTVRCQWQTYWRSIHWRIDPPEMFRPNIAFLSDCKFDHGRVLVDSDERKSADIPERLCMVRHYSWARSPEDIRNKLMAWGHAKETNPEWFNTVFMQWTPGHPMENVHPTVPMNYKRIVKCDLPLPEAMQGHPYVGLEIIQDGAVTLPSVTVPDVPRLTDGRAYRIKAVIMHYNRPENADKLYEQLAPVFDDVEIFDNGSDPGLVPIHVTRSRDNVYWTGTWNEVIATCSEYDAVWVLGCDVELSNDPKEYRKDIEDSLPFGCWSPCIDGRAHPFMHSVHYTDKAPKRVRNIEGMALAASGTLMRDIGELVPGSQMGYGQDFWMCYRARRLGLRNVIDGRVVVRHPTGIGYDDQEAGRQMKNAFGRLYGPYFARNIFEYDERYEYNLVAGGSMMPEKKFTIVTVDNGWGLSEFMRVTSKMENTRRIVMRKGIIEDMMVPGFEMIPYEESLAFLIKEADVAFFPRVGSANKDDYEKLLKAGVPIVIRNSCDQGLITHMTNGWHFQDESWALQWLNHLRSNPPEIERIRRMAAQTNIAEPSKKEPVENGCDVTVITPTFKREPQVILHCIGCMMLQTAKNWEQLICSDGGEEKHVKDLVSSCGDPRIQYHFLTTKKEGDFGNTVRSEMLKKARGKYVLFLDDDNLILPEYLAKMMSKLEGDPDCAFAVCEIMHFGPLNEKEVGKPPKVLTGDPVKLYHIDPLQVLVRRDVMIEIGWDTEVGYLSDGVTLEKLNTHKFVRVDEVLGVHM